MACAKKSCAKKSDTMKCMWLAEFGRFEEREVPKPQITRDDDVIIKVLVCSICGTDKGIYTNTATSYPVLKIGILGHEVVGEVDEVGPGVTEFKKGDRVVLNPNSWCGHCENCRNGYRNHCSNMELMGLSAPGGFAEYVKSQERLVFHISKKVPLNQAAFAEPLSCMLNGYSRLDITPGDTCVVIGLGPIGTMFAELAQRNGARVVAVEPFEARRKIAEKCGVETMAPCDDLVDKLKAKWGRRANYVICAAPGQLGTACEIAEFKGTILCFAGAKGSDSAKLGPIQSKELKIMGSFVINDSMPKAITVLENKMLKLDPMVTHVLPLNQLQKGIDLMKTGEGMEIILDIAETQLKKGKK